MLYEIGHVLNGEIVRGGIKAPLQKVGEWIEEQTAADHGTVYVAIPANDDAVTEEELFMQLDALFESKKALGV